ncbi:hypothetical protein LOAG_19247 [Loa loa]|uniref:Uncharacterized protein n=1 Tax=Loa loa TaxID=7209 RepID=A0A1S0UD28_LOALO|nr:hypothetical protein LOAG_19247 [Loa loa]EJD73331.1 hypothetical protein LOAG_19247 [Loa loa]
MHPSTFSTILSITEIDAQLFDLNLNSFNNNRAGRNSLNNGNPIGRLNGGGRRRNRPNQSTQTPLRQGLQVLRTFVRGLFPEPGRGFPYYSPYGYYYYYPYYIYPRYYYHYYG